jgi:hypothetical protein
VNKTSIWHCAEHSSLLSEKCLKRKHFLLTSVNPNIQLNGQHSSHFIYCHIQCYWPVSQIFGKQIIQFKQKLLVSPIIFIRTLVLGSPSFFVLFLSTHFYITISAGEYLYKLLLGFKLTSINWLFWLNIPQMLFIMRCIRDAVALWS